MTTTFRIPDDLHRWATIAAYDEGISLNAFIIQLLKQARDLDEQPSDYTEADHARALERGMRKVEAAARGESVKVTKTVGEA